MIVATQLVVTLVAALTWSLLVPRIRVDDDAAPRFEELVTPGSIAAVGIVGAALSQILWLVPPPHWWLWAPYLGLGLPLVAVDAMTTWLPRRLHRVMAGAMAIGLAALAAASWRETLAALGGAAAAYALFWSLWRLQPGLGFGDVRLAALVGAVGTLGGPMACATALLAGTLLGAAHGIVHAAWAARGPGRPRHFAYGPALWLGPFATALLSAG